MQELNQDVRSLPSPEWRCRDSQLLLQAFQKNKFIPIRKRNNINEEIDCPCFQDIKELVELNGLYYECIDKLEKGICMIDQTGRVIIWNSAAEELYNVKKSDIVGKKLESFFPNAGNVLTLEMGKSFNNTFHKPRKGTEIVLSTRMIYQNGKKRGVISVDQDTDQVMYLSQQLREDRLISQQLNQVEKNDDSVFLGNNKEIQHVVKLINSFAKTDIPALITGESGTGKEVFAKMIHEQSEVEGKLVTVNCSAIPDSLFESEFFGYVRGAFTGAESKGRKGFFELANNGTLLLDEVENLPLNQQSKLLRVVDEGKVTPLGSEKKIDVNVRIVSATNKDLKTMVSREDFREDLYYRLKGVLLQIPALRERKDDLYQMILFFHGKTCEKYNLLYQNFPEGITSILLSHSWPGNIRELKNVLRNLVILSQKKRLTIDDLPEELCYKKNEQKQESLVETKENNSLNEQINNYEYMLIQDALSRANNQVKLAAQELSIPRTTLLYKIKKHQIKI
ncbi:MAG: sigma 54-interacting transcriptional regulator [Lactococcus lactis]|uniref:sigma-54 interaction domain-containing protein n=1 Tax=Tetragenococcus halophilus TaxID=51669 RepID=UPI001F3B5AAE|nr:sigma 54-interacting transcriptional regulator [Tetragenococcus halophilus]MDN6139612.1 sigma 54-interacting transcriptional regulator [Tetragenococcus koreensis]MDN6167486.1 sigma 54-interacting transcriptional regulator [Lactococcus lactis]MDN6193827.1 sigma 54-interacting transcriptional regulator [Alkalibacterium sp.]MCF1675822.1 sigma 54-interacting transcriptional regulator [Tetragenococcus halophilus]MDN6267516.1 sigma 54-interacting transcriptional regulator [Tetragenococcus koreens